MNSVFNTRNVPLAYLRTFLVVLVVLHHAVLAYVTFAPPPSASLDGSLLWTAFPVVDAQRWSGADLIVTFNDSFFMSLLFLISGVFAWPALTRKGAAGYLRDRARRLGIPFLIAAGVLAPLAYFATWMAAPAQTVSFPSQWLALGVWPAGPAWFLWVLLAFALLAAIWFRVFPGWGAALARIASALGQRPVLFFLSLLAVSALVYLPMAAAFDPLQWVKSGPFFVQISRLPHYLVYFLVGVGLGAFGHDRGLLQADGRLARRWWLWVGLALLAFGVSLATLGAIVGSFSLGGPSAGLQLFGNFTFVLSCAASSMAFTALFVRFARRANPIVDSLSANAYGIYLLHYVCVTWLQFLLLPASWPGYTKAALVFIAALLVSWSLSGVLRRVPVIRQLV
ncbi:MAG: acyltransferase [Rhodanobacteraceae bacterium]